MQNDWIFQQLNTSSKVKQGIISELNWQCLGHKASNLTMSNHLNPWKMCFLWAIREKHILTWKLLTAFVRVTWRLLYDVTCHCPSGASADWLLPGKPSLGGRQWALCFRSEQVQDAITPTLPCLLLAHRGAINVTLVCHAKFRVWTGQPNICARTKAAGPTHPHSNGTSNVTDRLRTWWKRLRDLPNKASILLGWWDSFSSAIEQDSICRVHVTQSRSRGWQRSERCCWGSQHWWGSLAYDTHTTLNRRAYSKGMTSYWCATCLKGEQVMWVHRLMDPEPRAESRVPLLHLSFAAINRDEHQICGTVRPGEWRSWWFTHWDPHQGARACCYSYHLRAMGFVCYVYMRITSFAAAPMQGGAMDQPHPLSHWFHSLS